MGAMSDMSALVAWAIEELNGRRKNGGEEQIVHQTIINCYRWFSCQKLAGTSIAEQAASKAPYLAGLHVLAGYTFKLQYRI